jgi:hypothetical protein
MQNKHADYKMKHIIGRKERWEVSIKSENLVVGHFYSNCLEAKPAKLSKEKNRRYKD